MINIHIQEDSESKLYIGMTMPSQLTHLQLQKPGRTMVYYQSLFML